MSDFKDMLERERRKFAMGDEAMEGLERLRHRKRRRRQARTVALALVIAIGGTGGTLFALGGQHRATQPPITPTPSPIPVGPSAVLPEPTGPIQFIDATDGWLVWNNRVFATSDGGRSWHSKVSASLPPIAAGVEFIDPLHGWVVTKIHGLFATADGGEHWIHSGSYGGPIPPFMSVEFVSPAVGWALEEVPHTGGLGQLLTWDGSGGWRTVQTPGLVQSFCFSDRLHGIEGDGTTGVPTSDGGRYWETFPTSNLMGSRETAAVRCGPGREGWLLHDEGILAGRRAYFLTYSADGYLWHPVLHKGTLIPDLGGVTAQDAYPGPFAVTGPGSLAFIGWCPSCGESAAVYLTSDAGANWQRFVISAAAPGWVPLGLSFWGPDRGWILFESPSGAQVLATSDGGRTWTDPCRHPRSACFGQPATP